MRKRKILVFEVIIILFFGTFINPIISISGSYENDEEIFNSFTYEETLTQPWDDWDHAHMMDGAIGWDYGWEDGDIYDVHVYTDCVAAVVGAYGGHQKCWNIESWTPNETDWYRFKFDYNYDGWVNLPAAGLFGAFSYMTFRVFFNIKDSSDNSLYFFDRIVFYPTAIPYIPLTENFEGTVNDIFSPPILIEGSETVEILAGLDVYCFSVAAIGFSACVAETNGELIEVNIDNEIQNSPLLRVDPNPPNHDFGDISRNMQYDFEFNIWNGGIDELSWTINENHDWMSITPTDGTSDGEVISHNLTVDTSELSLGSYSGDFTIESNEGSMSATIDFEVVNFPPGVPTTPEGPTSGEIGDELTFSTEVYDDSNQVYYLFDWDDGADSGWQGPVSSESTVQESHTWNTAGTYEVKVKAKDEQGEISNWSESLHVTIEEQFNPPTVTKCIFCEDVEDSSGENPSGCKGGNGWYIGEISKIKTGEKVYCYCEIDNTYKDGTVFFSWCNQVGNDGFLTEAEWVIPNDWSSVDCWHSWTPTEPGKYFVWISYNDPPPYMIGESDYLLIVEDNQPPNAPCNPRPEDGDTDVDNNAVLHWDCSDPNDDSLTYYISVASPGKIVKGPQSEPCFSLGGRFGYGKKITWYVIARDGEFETRGPTWTFTIEETPALEVTCHDAVGKQNEEIKLSGSASGGYKPYEYQWDLNNDGTYDTDWSESSTTTHSWDSNGDKTIKLMVKDSHGTTDTDTGTVTVQKSKQKSISTVFLKLIEQYPLLELFLI